MRYYPHLFCRLAPVDVSNECVRCCSLTRSHSRERVGSPLVRAYLCKDGRKIFYCQPISWTKYWGRFTAMIGKAEEWGGFKNVVPTLNEEVHSEIEVGLALHGG